MIRFAVAAGGIGWWRDAEVIGAYFEDVFDEAELETVHHRQHHEQGGGADGKPAHRQQRRRLHSAAADSEVVRPGSHHQPQVLRQQPRHEAPWERISSPSRSSSSRTRTWLRQNTRNTVSSALNTSSTRSSGVG